MTDRILHDTSETRTLPSPVDPRWVVRSSRGHWHLIELWWIDNDGLRCEVADVDDQYSVIGCTTLARAEAWIRNHQPAVLA